MIEKGADIKDCLIGNGQRIEAKGKPKPKLQSQMPHITLAQIMLCAVEDEETSTCIHRRREQTDKAILARGMTSLTDF